MKLRRKETDNCTVFSEVLILPMFVILAIMIGR